MAMCNGTNPSGLKVHIEALQTVMPLKQTDPRQSRRVSAAKTLCPAIFQQRFQVVLYYKKASGDDSGWLLAGWIKESLGKALNDQPLLAGRLRQEKDEVLEIVSNDSGVRMAEAQIGMNLNEFLDLKEREEAEAELVYWVDIDEHNPQFFPLFYVQVTNFKCDGYSVGISCSLLLADPFLMTNFLKTWASIHTNIVCKTATPIFYLPNLRRTSCSPTTQNCSITNKNRDLSVIFKISEKNMNFDNEMQKTLAELCIEDAEQKLGNKMASKFSLFVRESSESIRVEKCLKQGLVQKPWNNMSQLSHGSWDELRADEVSFNEGKKPARVSYWINSFSDGLVIVIPYISEGVSGKSIIVTIPNEKLI